MGEGDEPAQVLRGAGPAEPKPAFGAALTVEWFGLLWLLWRPVSQLGWWTAVIIGFVSSHT